MKSLQRDETEHGKDYVLRSDALAAIDAAVAAERERWQRIAEAAQAITTGCEDRIDAFVVPSHLMAALALALDEGPNVLVTGAWLGPLVPQPPNAEGETLCHVRWMIETPGGWLGAWDKGAFAALIDAAVAAGRERWGAEVRRLQVSAEHIASGLAAAEADRDMLRGALAGLEAAVGSGDIDLGTPIWHALEDAQQALAQAGGTEPTRNACLLPAVGAQVQRVVRALDPERAAFDAWFARPTLAREATRVPEGALLSDGLGPLLATETNMAERTYEVRTVGVDYLCDECGDGVMVQTGVMLPMDPPKWRHKCNRCGDVADLWNKYPNVRWERLPSH